MDQAKHQRDNSVFETTVHRELLDLSVDTGGELHCVYTVAQGLFYKQVLFGASHSLSGQRGTAWEKMYTFVTCDAATGQRTLPLKISLFCVLVFSFQLQIWGSQSNSYSVQYTCIFFFNTLSEKFSNLIILRPRCDIVMGDFVKRKLCWFLNHLKFQLFLFLIPYKYNKSTYFMFLSMVKSKNQILYFHLIWF